MGVGVESSLSMMESGAFCIHWWKNENFIWPNVVPTIMVRFKVNEGKNTDFLAIFVETYFNTSPMHTKKLHLLCA